MVVFLGFSWLFDVILDFKLMFIGIVMVVPCYFGVLADVHREFGVFDFPCFLGGLGFPSHLFWPY